MKINCKYPVIILSPDIYGAVCRGCRTMFKNGEIIPLTSDDILKIKTGDWFPFKILNGYKLNDETKNLPLWVSKDEYRFQKDLYHRDYLIDYEDLDKYYLYNENSGEYCPLFQLVKCNHCSCCHYSKVQKWKNRCLFESRVHKNSPFFLTLTFSNACYPSNPYDLTVVTRHIQLFHKRLRKRLHDNGFNTAYKYFFVSEYGSQFGRLHFHGLIFGLDAKLYDTIPNKYDDKVKAPYIFKFCDFVRKAWKLGFCKVEECKDPTGAYTMKYINKQVGDQSTKMLHSVGFGKASIIERLKDLRRNPSLQEMSLCVDGIERTFPIDTYIRDTVYPSCKRTLSVKFRDALKSAYELSVKIDYLLNQGLFVNIDRQEFYKFSDTFLKKYEIPISLLDLNKQECIFDLSYSCSLDILYSQFCECLDVLSEFHYDFRYIAYLDDLNSSHVLASNFENVDVDNMSYLSDVYFGDLQSKESDQQ